MNKKTSTAIALVLGLAAPFAISGAASAVEVLFSDDEVLTLEPADAAIACGISEDQVGEGCESTMTSEEYLASQDGDGDDEDGPSENSAAAFAPGQLKEEGESAREYAPGQQAQENGGSASDYAPGQQKKD